MMNMNTKGRMKQIEQERGESLYTLIPRLLSEHGAIEPVADLLGVHYNTLYRWCEKAGIKRRVVFELSVPEHAY